jgi:hypothetical protein
MDFSNRHILRLLSLEMVIQSLTFVFLKSTTNFKERYRASMISEYKFNDLEFKSNYDNNREGKGSMTFSPKSELSKDKISSFYEKSENMDLSEDE